MADGLRTLPRGRMAGAGEQARWLHDGRQSDLYPIIRGSFVARGLPCSVAIFAIRWLRGLVGPLRRLIPPAAAEGLIQGGGV